MPIFEPIENRQSVKFEQNEMEKHKFSFKQLASMSTVQNSHGIIYDSKNVRLKITPDFNIQRFCVNQIDSIDGDALKATQGVT